MTTFNTWEVVREPAWPPGNWKFFRTGSVRNRGAVLSNAGGSPMFEGVRTGYDRPSSTEGVLS